jgi:hypothetical protein
MGLVVAYYLENKVSECTRNPLEYAVSKIQEVSYAESVYITLYIDGNAFTFTRGDIDLRNTNITINLSDLFQE